MDIMGVIKKSFKLAVGIFVFLLTLGGLFLLALFIFD
jgi:hypothetical protein